MTITTKLSVGQFACFLHRDRVECRKVDKILTTSLLLEGESEPIHHVNYVFKPNNYETSPVEMPEHRVFATKGELLESL